MTARESPTRRYGWDSLTFLLTNRIPRRLLTHAFGAFSRVEQRWVRDVSIAIWRKFADLDLSDAKSTDFRSLHDCFTRELLPGARRIDLDPAVVTSPCDAIVGACGAIEDGVVFQAKDEPYRLSELLQSDALAERHRGGTFVTLRLTASMYHRFHAPYPCVVRRVTYIAGDVFNVNPPALARIRHLFCRNERAVIETTLAGVSMPLTLVPVAAVLVASIRLTFVDVRLHLRYRGPNVIECDVALDKGEEMGWFEHGSTVLVFAPAGFTLVPGIAAGARIRMGEPLLALPAH
jgi:phosphatidylserine decarboxylase